MPIVDREGRKATIVLTRDSVCLADDVDAPHEIMIEVDPQLDLMGIADAIAATGRLPMPSDAWGWTIEVNNVVIAVRPRLLFGQTTELLRGCPRRVVAANVSAIQAIYVRPSSHWRDLGRPIRRVPAELLGMAGLFALCLLILAALK